MQKVKKNAINLIKDKRIFAKPTYLSLKLLGTVNLLK